MCVAECVIASHTSWMDDDDDDDDGSDQLLLVLVLEDDFVAKPQNMPIKIVVCVIWVLYPVAYVRYPFTILNSANMNVCMYVWPPSLHSYTLPVGRCFLIFDFSAVNASIMSFCGFMSTQKLKSACSSSPPGISLENSHFPKAKTHRFVNAFQSR